MVSWREILRLSAVVAVAGVTLLVPVILLQAGYAHDLFAMLLALAISGWIGAYAVLTGSVKLGYLGAGGLVAFSLWDALIQTAALPAAVLVALAVLAERRADDEEEDDPPEEPTAPLDRERLREIHEDRE